MYGLFSPPNGSFSVDELGKKVEDGGCPLLEGWCDVGLNAYASAMAEMG